MAEFDVIADQISHAYGSTAALTDVSFSVSAGCFFGLLGPNGSGKTTLFRLLATLLPLQQGTVSICGFDLATQQDPVRSRIGVTFQSPALDVRLTVRENLECHAAIYGLDRRTARPRMQSLCEQFRVADRIEDIVGTLSGGLKRRVELVKGLLHEPRLLLLDEPTTGLDVRSRLEFFQMLHTLRKRSGMTVVLATHLMEEAEQCDQLLLLDRGHVVRCGSPDEMKASLEGERLTVRCRDVEAVRAALTERIGADASQFGDELMFRLADPARVLPEILSRFGDQILSVQISRPSLDDVFLEMTGRLLVESDGAAVSGVGTEAGRR